jgi:drug/metabolite transporter (DMT)-like permease
MANGTNLIVILNENKFLKMKNKFKLILIFIGLGFFFDCQAIEYGYSNPIGYTSITDFLEGLLNNTQLWISWLAVIFIVIGGVLYMTASGKESQITLAKNTVVSALIGLALALAGPSLLKEIKDIFEANAESPDLERANTFVDILTNVMSFVLTIIVILAMMSLVYSGFLYLTSAGNRENIDKAKKIGKFSVLALVLSGSSIILINLILRFLGN